jgi:hypothetical protein
MSNRNWDAISNVIEIAPTKEIRDEYGDLTGSYAEACRIADETYRAKQRQAKRPAESPPKSTCDAIDWLLKYVNDAERLRKFLEGRREAELIKIQKYIDWKKSL